MLQNSVGIAFLLLHFNLSDKFTVSMRGVYKVSVSVTAKSGNKALVDVVWNPADGRGEQYACYAKADGGKYFASCSTLMQLESGDELYVKGTENGRLDQNDRPTPHFEAYLLYTA